MQNQELEAEIKRRQEEGRTLFHPAKLIACKYGVTHPKKHGSVLVFKDHILEIHYDTYAPNLTVYQNGISVLYFQLGKIQRYVPSDWVKHLRELAKPLLINEEAEKIAEQRERERKRLANWGL